MVGEKDNVMEIELTKWIRGEGLRYFTTDFNKWALVDDSRRVAFRAGWKAAMSSLTPPNVEDEWP